MKNNDHLVPVNIKDIVDRLKNRSIQENERLNLIHRLETIRDYCASEVAKNYRSPSVVSTRK